MELLILLERKLIIPLHVMNNPDEINYYFNNNFHNKIGIFVKFISKDLMRWQNCRRVQESRMDEFSRRRLIQNQETFHELTARIQELHYEVNCMNDSCTVSDPVLVTLRIPPGLTCTSPCNSSKKNNFDEINNFFMNNYWNRIENFMELDEKSLNEMEELKRFQGSTFETFSRRKIDRRSKYDP